MMCKRRASCGRLANGWIANACKRNSHSGAFTRFQLAQPAFCFLISEQASTLTPFAPRKSSQCWDRFGQPKAWAGQNTGSRAGFVEGCGDGCAGAGKDGLSHYTNLFGQWPAAALGSFR